MTHDFQNGCTSENSVSYFFTCSLSSRTDLQAEQFKQYDMEESQKYDAEFCYLQRTIIMTNAFKNSRSGYTLGCAPPRFAVSAGIGNRSTKLTNATSNES